MDIASELSTQGTISLESDTRLLSISQNEILNHRKQLQRLPFVARTPKLKSNGKPY